MPGEVSDERRRSSSLRGARLLGTGGAWPVLDPPAAGHRSRRQGIGAALGPGARVRRAVAAGSSGVPPSPFVLRPPRAAGPGGGGQGRRPHHPTPRRPRLVLARGELGVAVLTLPRAQEWARSAGRAMRTRAAQGHPRSPHLRPLRENAPQLGRAQMMHGQDRPLNRPDPRSIEFLGRNQRVGRPGNMREIKEIGMGGFDLWSFCLLTALPGDDSGAYASPSTEPGRKKRACAGGA
jgi:hypothetical protein